MTLKTPPTVPATEWSERFLQAMLDRMGMSYFKYGRVAEAYPARVDALKSLAIRLEKYERTGNTEHLVDAANFLMIEFMHPKHERAHFSPEDSKTSPGRIWRGEIDPSQRPNRL